VFWVISVYFNIRNTLPKFGTFLLEHPVSVLKFIDLRVKTCFVMLREKERLTIFKNMMLWKIFGPQTEEVGGKLEKNE
jgi:hypothetical protein